MDLNELKKITGTVGQEVTIRTLNCHSVRYRWVLCPECHKGRWVSIYQIRNRHYTGMHEACFLKRNFGIE